MSEEEAFRESYSHTCCICWKSDYTHDATDHQFVTGEQLRRELDKAKAKNRVQDEQYRQHIDRLQERIAELEAREKEYIEECNKHFDAVQVANKYSAKLEAELKAMKESRDAAWEELAGESL